MIKVIDAPCGAGKSSWAIQFMNDNPDKKFIYCTPYLNEFKRIKSGCPKLTFFEPNHILSRTKLESFSKILANRGNATVTHRTFLNANKEIIDLIGEGHYNLIIDEVVSIFEPMKDIADVEANVGPKGITKSDIDCLIKDLKAITVEEDGRVIWRGVNGCDDCSYESDWKYSVVRKYALLKRLYLIDNKLLMVIFPPEVFKRADSVHILTYMFNASYLRYYFDKFGINYELCSIEEQENRYTCTDYNESSDIAFRKMCKDRIKIISDAEIKNINSPFYRRTDLSMSYYNKNKIKRNAAGNKSNGLADIKTNLGRYYRYAKHEYNAKIADFMWTCYKDFKECIKGDGYTEIKRMTKAEKANCTDDEIKRKEKEYSCFVPCNERATNIYSNRWVLAYCSNIFCNPEHKKLFTTPEGKNPIDDDAYALSCLIQWICRSNIRDRDSNHAILLYLPSLRMRSLFENWINIS